MLIRSTDICGMKRTGKLTLSQFKLLALLLVGASVWPEIAAAQTDEIQVYNAEIAEPGELTLTLHNNFTPEGLQEAAFPGAVVPNHELNGVPEFGYGAAPWLELGMYLPVYTLLT